MLNSLLNKHYHVWSYVRSVCRKKSFIYTQIILTFINVHARITMPKHSHKYLDVDVCNTLYTTLYNLKLTHTEIYILFTFGLLFIDTFIYLSCTTFFIISIYSSSIIYANHWKILFLPFYSNFVLSCFFWGKFF